MAHTTDDEALARALQEEYDNDVPAERSSSKTTAVTSSTISYTLSPPDASPNESTAEGALPGESDAEMARRVTKELADQDMAEHLARKEEELQGKRMAHQVWQKERNTCTKGRILMYAIPVLVVIGAVIGLVIVFGVKDGDVGLKLDDIRRTDPNVGTSLADTNQWLTDGTRQGLELEILNSLTTDWYQFFYDAVSNWNNDGGSPEALILTTDIRQHEQLCSPINGKLKVCNGNYGATGWRGINEIAIQNGFIIASTAKMNENYFTGASNNPDQKQYTMCHEQGHGFGLPHTDESFNNADMGDCMDYTVNPGNNKLPGDINLQRLQQLYGDVPGSTEDAAGGGGRGLRGGRVLPRQTSLSDEELPALIQTLWEAHMPELEGNADDFTHIDGWRVLHRSKHAIAHEIDLGDGMKLQVHKLLVSPEDAYYS